MPTSKARVYVHLVWTTVERRPLISEEVSGSLCRWLHRVVRDLGCKLVAVSCLTDHVHLLIRMSHLRSISEIVRRLKGSSSHFLNKEFGEEEWFRWQRGYGAFSVSRWDVARVAKYIRNQKQHHSDGTEVGSLEPDVTDSEG